VFMDEAGVNLAMVRLYARSLKGQRAIGDRPATSGEECVADQCAEFARPDCTVDDSWCDGWLDLRGLHHPSSCAQPVAWGSACC
jgi:hypothetical protein